MKKRFTIRWALPTLLLLFTVACTSSPPQRTLENTVTVFNTEQCAAFRVANAPSGTLYFTGSSEWSGNLDESKTRALQSAQQQLGRSLQARVSSQCREESTASSRGGESRESLQQQCISEVQSNNVEVGALSGATEYCTQSKSYVLAGRSQTAFQSVARISLSNTRFEEATSKASLPTSSAPAPCWLDIPESCEAEASFVTFTGQVEQGRWNKRVLLQAAIANAQSQLAAYLKTTLETEYSEKIICDSNGSPEPRFGENAQQCRAETLSRMVSRAQHSIRGSDFETTETYQDSRYFYVRIRLKRDYVEQQLKQAIN